MTPGQGISKIFNIIFGPKHPLPMSWIRIQVWCLFLASAIAMVILCFQGGHWGGIGHHSFSLTWPLQGNEPWVVPAGGFMLLWAATFTAYSLLFFTLPRGLSPPTMAAVILMLAIICRVMLLPHPPSNDSYRYLWEGRLITEQLNPYQYAPSDPQLAHLAEKDPLHSKINHPKFSAIYPPLFQYIMAIFVWSDGSIAGLKRMIMWVDLASLLLILRLLYQRGQDLRWGALYAFNPVILYAFAAHGHMDVFQNFFLLAAIYLYGRRRWCWMFVMLGASIQCKYMAVFTIPLFVRRENWYYLPIMIITVIVPFIALMDGEPSHFFTSLISFSQNFALNGSLHKLLRLALGDILPATRICQVLFAMTLCWGLVVLHPQRSKQMKDDPLTGCFFIFTSLLLLSPTVHYWYLSWALIFLPFHPHIGWNILTLTTGAYFVVYGNQLLTGQYAFPAGYQLYIWTIPWLFFIRTILRFPTYFRLAGKHSPVKTISVVIPTLNEAKQLYACITRLNQDSSVLEVIVVDGGSKDHTISEAKRAGAKIMVLDNLPETHGGRGGQIAGGVATAKGDVVAVVHADTLVQQTCCSRVIDYLNRHPMVVGGALGSYFDTEGMGYRILELANDVRAVALGITFGDQVQFFRREPIVTRHLYPNQPLMEDVELSLRLKQMGRRIYLFSSSRVSARRWQKTGAGQVGRVLRLFVAYLWQRLFGRPDTVAMYRQYYRK